MSVWKFFNGFLLWAKTQMHRFFPGLVCSFSFLFFFWQNLIFFGTPFHFGWFLFGNVASGKEIQHAQWFFNALFSCLDFTRWFLFFPSGEKKNYFWQRNWKKNSQIKHWNTLTALNVFLPFSKLIILMVNGTCPETKSI